MTEIKNKYDFVLYVDVTDGNPNGDPDADGAPRVELSTNRGIISAVCLKRKIRDYIQATKQGEPGYDIFVRNGAILNKLIEAEYDAQNGGAAPKNLEEELAYEEKTREGMCKKYYDIRAFGAVMSTGSTLDADDGDADEGAEDKKTKKKARKVRKAAGQVRGPVQLNIAKSIDPITVQELCLTRCAVTNEKDVEKRAAMGRQYVVPYGLYCTYGSISPHSAAATGLSEEDVEVLWEAIQRMFDLDRSAARGLMRVRKLIIFEHSSPLGDCDPYDRVEAVRLCDGSPYKFEDYEIRLDGRKAPDGVIVRIPAKV